jgi:hypothetical protein
LIGGKGNKKKASPLYRTATTICLCCLPALEDLKGAGRIRLAFGAKVKRFFRFQNLIFMKHSYSYTESGYTFAEKDFRPEKNL